MAAAWFLSVNVGLALWSSCSLLPAQLVAALIKDMDSDFATGASDIDESGCLAARDEMVILGHFKMKMRADLDRKDEDQTDGWPVRTCLLAKRLCERIEEGHQRIDAARHRLEDQRKQLEALKTTSLCFKAKRVSCGFFF
ncbi:unnamed protein product [Dibothriocephalus latus]|uniref:Uncharacterized protein n=1 Tax=Dibothriocephalus latus TaxID=60516 RepID=A0A3P7PDF4_DIBLA|nr:unnamed protein product [Dibothriocephalus latus]